MEATTPELGPVRFWSPKSSPFSGSDSIVVEEAAKNFVSCYEVTPRTALITWTGYNIVLLIGVINYRSLLSLYQTDTLHHPLF